MALPSRLVVILGTGGERWTDPSPDRGGSCALGILAGSWSHWGGVSAGALLLCQAQSLHQGLEELVAEGPRPWRSGEVLLSSAVGQDPLEKLCLLLGQLHAVILELWRSTALVELEERKPMEFLKRRVEPPSYCCE